MLRSQTSWNLALIVFVAINILVSPSSAIKLQPIMLTQTRERRVGEVGIVALAVQNWDSGESKVGIYPSLGQFSKTGDEIADMSGWVKVNTVQQDETPSPPTVEPTNPATATARAIAQAEAQRNNLGIIACASVLVLIVLAAMAIYLPRR